MRGCEQIPWLYDPLCAVMEACGLGRWRRWLAKQRGVEAWVLRLVKRARDTGQGKETPKSE